MKKHIACLGVLLLLLTGCTQNNTQNAISEVYDSNPSNQSAAEPSPENVEIVPVTLDAILAMANENHRYPDSIIDQKTMDALHERLSGSFAAADDQEIARQVLENDLLQQADGEQPKEVTLEQAKEDVNFLFRYLKYGYSGYAFFGGDEVFLQAKQELMEDLDTAETIHTEKLAQLIQDKLYPLVTDHHFSVSSRNNQKRTGVQAYMLEERNFYLDQGGYYCDNDGKKLYLKGLEQAGMQSGILDVTENLHPFLQKDGSICYRVIATGHEAPAIRLVWEDSTQEYLLTPMEPAQADHPESTQLWSLEHMDEIPVLRIKSFFPQDDEQTKSMEELVQTGSALRGEPYLVIDLRGNGGGMAYYGAQWLAGFTESDQYQFGSSVFATLVSETVKASIPDYYSWYIQSFYDPHKAENDLPTWQVNYTELHEPVQNDTTVFVLMDESSLSAAEYFVTYLMETKNTVLVGQKTGGAFNFGGFRQIRLPHSSIGIGCSLNVYLTPDMELVDGVGFLPDVWCDTDNSLDAVLSLIHT